MIRIALGCALMFTMVPLFGLGTTHTTKVLVEGQGIPASEVARLGGEVVREYPAFTVVRLPQTSLQAFEQSARSKSVRFELHGEWDTVQFAQRAVDTRITPGQLAPMSGDRLLVVQFSAPLSAEDEQLLATAGLVYIGYLPHNAVLAVGPGSALTQVAQLPGVQWYSPYEREHKPSVVATPVAAPVYIVQFASTPVTAMRIKEFRATHEVLDEVSYLRYTNFKVQMLPTEAAALLDDPFVVAVELAGEVRLSGEREAIGVSPLYGGAYVYQAPVGVSWQPFRTSLGSYTNWLPVNASGYRIAVADTGLAQSNNPCLLHTAAHPDLQNTNISWGTDFVTAGNCLQDTVGHGTMVAGFAAANPTGAGTDTSANGTFNYAMGVAPTAGLLVQRISGGTSTVGTVQQWAAEALGAHCVAQTYSYNEYVNIPDGTYPTLAQQFDTWVRDTPMPMTVAAGNICDANNCSTMVLSPATAKNVITVGAAESYRPIAAGDRSCTANPAQVRPDGWFEASSFNNVAYVSRRGTTDLRVKPDIIAPATMASSTHAGGAPNSCKADPSGAYGIDSGTSFASPQVAAAIALISAKFGIDPVNAPLSPAMAKAALIGSARSVKGGYDHYDMTNATVVSARPNPTQGFGRLYLADILAGSTAYNHLWDESAFTPFTGSGQQRLGNLTITDQSKPVVLVLAWTDEPAQVNASTTLVRNLNLDVIMGCTAYFGNIMDATTEYSTAQGACGGPVTHDNWNNVEMVVIPPNSGASFTYKVWVASWGLGSATQKFALFASNVN